MPDATTAETPIPSPIVPEVADGQAQAPKVDTEGAEAAKAAAQKPVSDGFAALARKEKSVLRKAQEVAERERQLAEREKTIAAQAAEWEAAMKAAKGNPQEALKKLGLEFEEVARAYLNEKPTVDTEVARLRAEIERWQQQTAAEKKAAQEAAQKAAQEHNAALVQDFYRQIESHLTEHAADYPIITALEAANVVFRGIEETARETGRIPTIAEAAAGTEKFLAERLDPMLTKSKWFTERYAPRKAQAAAEAAGKGPSPTISNDLGSTATSLPALTEAERIKRAIAAMQAAEEREG